MSLEAGGGGGGGGGESKDTTIADFKDVVDKYLKLLSSIRQTGHRVNRKDKRIPLYINEITQALTQGRLLDAVRWLEEIMDDADELLETDKEGFLILLKILDFFALLLSALATSGRLGDADSTLLNFTSAVLARFWGVFNEYSSSVDYFISCFAPPVGDFEVQCLKGWDSSKTRIKTLEDFLDSLTVNENAVRSASNGNTRTNEALGLVQEAANGLARVGTSNVMFRDSLELDQVGVHLMRAMSLIKSVASKDPEGAKAVLAYIKVTLQVFFAINKMYSTLDTQLIELVRMKFDDIEEYFESLEEGTEMDEY